MGHQMNASENLELDPVRQKLLRAKLGWLLTWSKPEIFESIGPYEPEQFERYDATRRSIITQCRDELARRTDAEIAVLTKSNLPDPAGLRESWASFEDEDVSFMRKESLPWYIGGFGHPAYQADFEYWSKMPHFSVEELLHLSVGIEPKHFDQQTLETLGKHEDWLTWPAEIFLLRRLKLLRRQFDPHSCGYEVHPKSFLSWADKFNFETAPKFLTLLRKYHGDDTAAPLTKTQSSDAKPKTQDKREMDSIAQLFTAMAMEYFGYNPNDAKSSVTKEITDLAASMGLSLSDDTVRKYLQMGRSHVPKDWTPNNR